MTHDRHDHLPDDPDAVHDPDATREGDAVGARIRALAGEIEAPPALRARIAEERRRRRGGAWGGRRRWWVALPAGALAAAAVVVALVVGGGAAGPTVGDAAALALKAPDRPAPAVDAGDAHLVQAEIGGIRFPNYAYTWQRWRAAGQRDGTLSGRAAKVVTYRGPLGDVGYAIVDGEPLPEPGGARRVTAAGQRFALLRQDGAVVVTWRRAGHTCVLAGRDAPGMEARLLAFATWA